MEKHQVGVDNPDFYDTTDSVPCVVCGKLNLLDNSGKRRLGRFGVKYYCNGKHTSQTITDAIAQKERKA